MRRKTLAVSFVCFGLTGNILISRIAPYGGNLVAIRGVSHARPAARHSPLQLHRTCYVRAQYDGKNCGPRDCVFLRCGAESGRVDSHVDDLRGVQHISYVDSKANVKGTSTSKDAKDNAAPKVTKLWNRRYKEGAFVYLDTDDAHELFQDVATRVRDLGSRSLLDVGCWHGNLLKHLADLDRYVGLDASTMALDKAREIDASFPTFFQCGNLEDMPVQDESFDLIYFGGCLGYCRDPVAQVVAYADRYTPRHIILQEATKFLNLEKLLPRLWMTSRFDLLEYWAKEYPIDRFRGRKVAVLQTQETKHR